MVNPYKSQSNCAFWSRAVAAAFSAKDSFRADGPLVRKGEKLASAGSCFASNMISYLEIAGVDYVRTEKLNPVFGGLDLDNFGYSTFSAAYGNIFTPRQLSQLLARANGNFYPAEDRWTTREGIADPFRPGMKFKARTDREFEALRAQHFGKTIEVFKNADVFVFTLGLTEAWVSRLDGAVFPLCPGIVAGEFEGSRHEFKNFSVKEATEDLSAAIEAIRLFNPAMRFIITVSPVPLVATATSNHVLTASIYSKSVLRVAAEEVVRNFPLVVYFPSYEIVVGPQASEDFIEPDRRNVSKKGIAEVMAAFLAHCELDQDVLASPLVDPSDRSSWLSSSVVEAECEEVMIGR